MSYREIKPMLAAEEHKLITQQLLNDPNWIAEEKYNGCRYIAHFEKERVFFTSRHYSKEDPSKHVEKGMNLPHLNTAYKELEGTVLDGEICKPGTGSSSYKVTKFMGADPDKAIAYQKQYGWGCYRVWDVLFYNGEDVRSKSLRERKEILKEVITCWERVSNKKINGLVECVLGRTDKETLLKEVQKRNGEGIVLKNLSQPYVENGRNKDYWMKVKKEQTWDCIVMGYEEPKQFTIKVGDTKETVSKLWKNNWIGAIVFGMYKGSQLIEVGKCSGMPDAVRKAISTNKNGYLGKVIEVKGQEMTEAGAIQHPRFIGFREDKDPKDCKF